MMEFLRFTFQDLAHFIGILILIGAIGEVFIRCWKIFWKYISIIIKNDNNIK
jgi:hypothetical protein